MFDKPVSKIVYCYTIWCYEYNELRDRLGDMIEFRKDFPSQTEICDYWEAHGSEVICVCDDKMQEFLEDTHTGKALLLVATTLAHHAHFSLFLTVQNLFHGSKVARGISLNSHYFCIFRNPRGVDQVKRFGQQVLPGFSEYFMSSYFKAIEENYSYLFVDLSPHSDPRFKLKSQILPGQQLLIYLPDRK